MLDHTSYRRRTVINSLHSFGKKTQCRYPSPRLWRGARGEAGLAAVSTLALLILLFSPLPAQVSPAGRWRTLHSQHFRVHFRPGQDSIARHAVEEGERAYYLLSTELVEPRQPIDLVLSDAADFPNGSAGIFPSNRITLLLVPPPDLPDLQNYEDWIRVLLIHELTHIFHLDRVKGPWRLIHALFGRVPGAFPNIYQPSWVSEGIATYYESHFSRRGRIRGSFHSEVLLSLAAHDRWPRPNQATYISEKWPDGVAPYAFGSRFFDYLAGAAGDSSVPRFIERTSGQWVPFRTGRPLRLATGLRRDSLWYAQASGYRERAQGRPRSESEVIVRGLRLQPSPAISSDGSLAWFQSSLNEAGQIVVRRPNGSEKTYLTTGGVDLGWSGDTLYATRLELSNPATYRSDLHRLVDGNWEQVTHGERLTDLATGPGGVVAVQITETGNRLVRISGGQIQRLATYADPASGFATPTLDDSTGTLVAVWHHAGLYHLLEAGDSVGNWMVSGRWNEVLADPQFIRSAIASLVYVSDRTGLPQVHLLMHDGSVRQVTDEPFGARQPAISPDGWLYFTSLEEDGFALKRRRWREEIAFATIDFHDRLPDTTKQEENPHPLPLSWAMQPVRETGYSSGAALRPHYFIPYLVDKGSAGYFLGGFTSGSDPVGRFFYALRGAGGFEGGKIDASIYLTYRRWNHHSLDLYLAQDNGDAGIVAIPETLSVQSRERDAEIGLNTSWRRWYRSVTFRLAADYEEDRFTSEPAVAFINPRFGAASAGVSWGRTLRPPLAISDEDGASISLRYRRRWRLDRDGGSDEWRGRLAIYQSIKGVGGFAHPVIAGRISAATSSGDDRETFGVGGASGITYQPLPGIVAGSSRAFPVRGFEAGEIRGGTVAVATAEIRVPLALVAQPLGDLPYGLDRVSLRIFYDYGRVWEPPIPGLPRWIHSAGVEVTWDLLVLYDVPLRLRTGVAAALNDGSVTRQGDVRFGLGFGSEF